MNREMSAFKNRDEPFLAELRAHIHQLESGRFSPENQMKTHLMDYEPEPGLRITLSVPEGQTMQQVLEQQERDLRSTKSPQAEPKPKASGKNSRLSGGSVGSEV
jgi:hypothetical protein